MKESTQMILGGGMTFWTSNLINLTAFDRSPLVVTTTVRGER